MQSCGLKIKHNVVQNLFCAILTFIVTLTSCTNKANFGTATIYTFPGISGATVLDDGSISLNWEEVPDTDVKYYVYQRKSDTNFSWATPLQVVSTNSYKIEAYKLDQKYCFAVRFSRLNIEPDSNTTEFCPDLPYVKEFAGIEQVAASDTGQVTVSWTKSSEPNLKGYNIYKGEGFKELAASVGAQDSTAIVNNLPVDVTLTFGVRAVDKYGREDSNTLTKSVLTINNVAPTFEGLKTAVQVTGDSIKLTWLAASGSPKEYRVYSAQAAANATPTVSFTTPTAIVTAPATSTTISGLGDELAHGFVVRSVSSGGQEDKNVIQQNVVLPDVGAPVFAGLKTFSFSEGGAQLTWDTAVGETTKYRVYYKEGNATAFTFGSATSADIAAPSTGTTISGLLDARDWTFAVRAVDSHNQSDTNVVTKTVTAGDLTPAAFTGYVGIVALDETRLSIEFNRAVETDVSHYSIRIKRVGTADTFTEKTTASQVSSGTVTKIITGLLPATNYEVLVKVIDTSGNPSTNSSTLTRATLDLTAPTFNGITSVAQKSTDASKAVVTWAAASDAGTVAEYRVYYSKTTLIGQTLLRTGTFPSGTGDATIYMSNAVTSGTTLEIPALTEGAGYFFVVHAIDAAGNEDSNTNQAGYSVPYYTPPQPPTGLSIVGGNGPSTNRSPFIAFSSTAGYSVKVYVNAVLNATKAINTTGADTIQLAILPNTSGNYAVTIAHVNQSNVEGNAAAVATYNLFIDVPVASLSGSPASDTTTSALNITVSNASNVTTYKYSLLANQSTACSAATYSVTWIAVATNITDSISSDGAYRLCVIAKNTAGIEQDAANATVVNFTRDTAAPNPPTTLTLSDTITSSTTVTFNAVATATVTTVAGVAGYCVTPTNSAPAAGDACWTTNTTTTVTLTGNNAYAWTKKSSGQVSATSTADSITFTNLCATGSLATGQTCSVTTAKTLSDGDVVAGQGNLTISTGGSITLAAEARATITLNGNFTISSGTSVSANLTVNATNITINGTLSANGKGYQGAVNGAGSPGASGGQVTSGYGGGGGHAGAGGASGGNNALDDLNGGAANASLNGSSPITFGGSGGGSASEAGAAGGGAIKLNSSGTLTIDGTISALGADSVSSGSAGGGAGGSVWLIASTAISGVGTVSVKGGAGSIYGSGTGGGGAISISSPTPFRGTFNIDGGSSGKDTSWLGAPGKLTTNYTNPCDSGSLSTTCTVSSTITWGTSQSFSGSGNLVIANGGTLKVPTKMQTMSIAMTGSITVESGGSILANLTNVTATDFSIDSGGIVSASGLGYVGSKLGSKFSPTGLSALSNSTSFYGVGSGGGHGGNGGAHESLEGYSAGSIGDALPSAPGVSQGSATQPVMFGGAGGGTGYHSGTNCPGADYLKSNGAAGGGAIKISVSGTLTVNGSLTANGVNGCGDGSNAYTGGGGAGGSIWLAVSTLSGSGTITATGGDAGLTSSSVYRSGGGGGGRIAAYNTNKFSGTVTANGGIGYSQNHSGKPGTVYFANNADNYCNSGTMATTCTVSQTWGLEPGWTFGQGAGNLVIANLGKIYVSLGQTAAISMAGDITVQSGGSIVGNYTITANNVTVASGGTITAQGWGHLSRYSADGNGLGGGKAGMGTGYSGGGGAHGGAGSGPHASLAQATTYGSSTAPLTFGSAGGPGHTPYGAGGSGGGYLNFVVTQTLSVAGTISANGAQGYLSQSSSYPGGGGAGGSIKITANTVAGAGSIIANGGDSKVNSAQISGAGGGGRIAITRTTDTFSGTRTANGGAGSGAVASGGNGTVVLQ